MFNLRYSKPEQFVPRHLTSWVKERVMADGSVLVPIDENEVRKAARELIEKACQSIAISFTNSYANSEHEEKARRVVKEELCHGGRARIFVNQICRVTCIVVCRSFFRNQFSIGQL